MRRFANFLLGLVALVSAISLVQATGKINWTGPCPMKNQSVQMTCGTLDVPLDYTDQGSTKTLTLDIAKVPGTETPRGKSVLLNFGGPGEPSLTALANAAGQLQATLGGHVDLVTFNTRGIGSTIPFSCYDSDAERMSALLMESPLCSNASDTAVGTTWAAATNVANACYAHMNETGNLYGTSFIARDMMQIVDALSEDGLLHYWGFSYGTILGATAAAMFPDRMGTVVLDGVLNPYEYYHGYDNQQATDSDSVFAGFCSSCLQAPKLCRLSSLASSESELEAKLWNLLDILKYHPISLGASLLDYATVKANIFHNLYTPSTWPDLSELLFAAITGNVTAINTYLAAQSGNTGTSKESTQGIKCSDKSVRAQTLSQFKPVVERAYHTSRIEGDVNVHINMECAQWNMSAKEHYGGDFRVKTRNPVLLVGNTWDPATPFVSAQNVSEALEGSVLLRHNGYGHASIGQPSLCTGLVLRDYFVNGTLPPEGKVCEPSIPPFSNKTWKDVFI